MAIAIKYKLRNLLILILFSLSVKSQIIAPLSYTPSGFFDANSHINACIEDSANNRLYLQNSCICGIGPGNVISEISYADLLTNFVYKPYYLNNAFLLQSCEPT